MSILDEFPEDEKWLKTASGDCHSCDYVKWLEEKVEDFEKRNEVLRKDLASARRSLENTRYKETRRFRDEQDYLPYEERYE